LVHRYLNEFAAKLSKLFPPHFNNVSTLPWETRKAYQTRATTEFSEKEAPEIIPPQL